MKTIDALVILALIGLSFVAAWFASTAVYGSVVWALLTLLSVVLFMAAPFRLHAVLNAPRSDR